MAASSDTLKQRELVFSSQPSGQAERAYDLLKGLGNLKVEYSSRPGCLCISYDLLDYSLEGLEQALINEGFHFDESPLQQIGKKLIHYREEVEYHNLNIPQRLTKSREHKVFAKAYEHHLHGDHDDTPPELREYK